VSRRPLALATAVAVTAALGAGTAAEAAGGTVKAALRGKNELKGGAAKGKGTFSATFRGGKLCYKLRFSGIGTAVASHIHKGTAKQDGPIVLDLEPKFRGGKASGCVAVKASLRKAIAKHPSRYYTNVHTAKFPGGAIRGQLR
jgi:hypothetical protein